MLNHEWIEKTERFLKDLFDDAKYLNEHPEDKTYRIEHTCRVANIGKQIASKEGFDETEMVIACLLHDVSYCEEFGEDGWKEHGRRSAKIARPFLMQLGMNEDRIDDICYGIAIHVDDKADFEGERTAFALSVGDADNIDRFDAYRIHEKLANDGFLKMSFEQKNEYLTKQLERLRQLADIPLATETANQLWKERLSFYIEFDEKLLSQLEYSRNVIE